MRVGFVGNGTDKFTTKGYYEVRAFIEGRLRYHPMVAAMVSGHSPVGGVDIWAEDVASSIGVPLDLKIPEVNQWNPVGGYGYKARNLDIARDSTILYVVLADVYPAEYQGRKFSFCYHCAKARPVHESHVKSGGCWTGMQATRLGRTVVWHVVHNY